ncbi:MAG: peptidoglycan-binding protein [Candidatus Sungbacteria bacterium]|nr:peptidoglycan-binding protein [Candidatus Sungbacteria bacterium]
MLFDIMSHLKKLFLAALIAGFVLGPAIPSYAQTSSASAQTLIATLQAQIAELQRQLEALKQAQSGVMAASAQVAETAKLLRHLREGMTGDDVKTLQAILAKYPDIYPEGLITGFYGKATARAVKKFQEREGVEGVGFVGPKTLARLLRELEKDPIGHEEEDDDEDHNGKEREKRPCAMVPPGHLIAPGWLRKHDGMRPIVPPCQKLPPGIEDQLKDKKGTTTPDTVAPVISGLTASSITTTGAHIKWTTTDLGSRYGAHRLIIKHGILLLRPVGR